MAINYFKRSRERYQEMSAKQTQRLCVIVAGVLAILAAVSISVGVGVSTLGPSHNTRDPEQSDTSGTDASIPENSPPGGIHPFASWDWTGEEKAYGVALGNWLLLERWMDEDWFIDTAGDEEVYDEWNWSLAVQESGRNVTQVLEDRFNAFITESDIVQMSNAGVSMVRIPIGFWAFIDTERDEPYVNAGQLQQIDRILPWLYEHNMHVILDLHGLPGSQNGAQPSGHNSSTLEFYNADQQKRSDETVEAAIQYILESRYSFLFSALAVCNEPVTYSDEQLDVLGEFYERSYEKTSEADIPLIFHHGFQGTDYWKPFYEGKNASLLILEDHPYPGNFPVSADNEAILEEVCYWADTYANLTIPVLVSEWSLMTGVHTEQWFQKLYIAQTTAWAWSAGSVFWSWKTAPASDPVLMNNTNWEASSLQDLLHMPYVVPLPHANSTTQDMVDALGQPCGAPPHLSWDSPIP